MLADLDPATALGAFTGIAIAVALLSATQDIALDAYRIEIAEVEMQGVLAAAYQYGYRVAIAVGTAGALYIAEFGSWSMAYKSMGACMAVGVITTLLSREPASSDRVVERFSGTLMDGIGHWLSTAVIGPFADFFRRYGRFAVLLLAFIAVFRISDYVLGILANPFYLDIGFSKAEIASVAKIYGLWVSLAGTAAGAWAILQFGLARCVVLATVLIAGTNLFFAALSLTGPSLSMLTATISADNFAMGFAGTVFIAYLSSLTNIAFTATQYALFSSASTFFGKLTAGYSGNVQESLGWTGFFLYACAVGIPAIVLSVFIARYYNESQRLASNSSGE
ncbi:MAG: AmpG family muropeptide MFS transporter [Woeseiaceae bacterium]|nr:AmpG family muropeptide MFS transporter [Woeseiaceae bacterium]